MAKEVALFNPDQMPAHIAKFLDAPEHQNVADKQTTNQLTFAGKAWAITIDGDKKVLTRKNEDGDDINVSILSVHILDYAQKRGRAYYEGPWDRDNVKPPACWSDDGVKPHVTVESPQASKCDGCPMSIKGTKVSDDNKTTAAACAAYQMLAVTPKLDAIVPLRLKLSITSIWAKDDKENQAKDWYAFQQYLDYLRTRGIKNTGAVITKLKFDTTEYPKILFKAGGWATPEQLERVAALAAEEDTKKLLHGSWTVSETAAEPKGKALPEDEGDEDAPAPVAPKAKPKAEVAAPKAKAAPAPADEDEDEVIPPSKASPKADAAKPVATANPKRAAAVAAAQKAAAEAAAALAAAEAEDEEDAEVAAPAPVAPPKKAKAKVEAAAPPAKQAKPPVDEDEDEPPAKQSAAKPKGAATAPAVTGAVPKGVADLLTDWEDD